VEFKEEKEEEEEKKRKQEDAERKEAGAVPQGIQRRGLPQEKDDQDDLPVHTCYPIQHVSGP
jgi:hypothetical protein